MNRNELPDYSVYMIMESCKNNLQPYLDAFMEKCIWIGPSHAPIIRSKKELIAFFESEVPYLTYSVQNLQVIPIPINTTSLNIVLTYLSFLYFPNGETITFRQRQELLWVERKVRDDEGNTKKEYAIRFCHVSNETPYDKRDMLYPNHFTEMDIAQLYASKLNSSKFSLKGIEGSYFFLSSNSIMWMESQGIHTIIYTVDKVYESTEKLAAIANKYADTLCKVHASFVVNPLYVAEIGRFFVKLQDGTRISIPEKKYTTIRDEIKRRLAQIDAANK